MTKSLRNQAWVPELDREGVFVRPLDVPKADPKDVSPFERMHAHHTLASARRFAYFKPFDNLIPQDDLDFVLASPYDHSYEIFPDKIDVYLQKETLGRATWRQLRNTAEFRAAVEARANIPIRDCHNPNWVEQLPHKLNKAHPVVIAGIKARVHPSNVKLMNSSHHSPQTNGGYSRQDSDGNFYQY